MNVIVIGSGFGGLAAAIRLQAQGYQVTIVEKRQQAGGRAFVTYKDGYTFDNGPTILTAPWMIEELFSTSGKSMDDYVELVKLDPFYRIRFEDGSIFTYNDNKEELEAEIAKFDPRDVESYRRFMKQVEKIYTAGMDLVQTPFHELKTMLKALPNLIKLRSDKSVYTLAKDHFHDHRLRQVFSFHPLLIGGSPMKSSSIYALIHKLEQEYGVWFAMGGTGALVNGLVKLFTDIGGTIRYQAEVERIAIDDRSRRASGVILANGEGISADVVVSNGDVASTMFNLVDSAYKSSRVVRRLNNYEYSMSLFVIYFGTSKKYEDIAHHEILMGPRYEGLLQDLFKHKVLADDFSLYLHRPTATDPSLAPEGHDSWYVLSPVPNLGADIDWEIEGPKYCDKILAYLEEKYLPNLSENITTKFYIDPNHFKNNLNSHLGSAFSVAPTLMQSAWMRPHNRSAEIPNLYFAGAGTHPGAGLPGVISSGKIVSDLISEDFSYVSNKNLGPRPSTRNNEQTL